MCISNYIYKCGHCHECIGEIKREIKKLYCNNCGDELSYYVEQDGIVYVDFCKCLDDKIVSAYSDGFDSGFDAGESEI